MIGIDSFTIKPIHDYAERSRIKGFATNQLHPATSPADTTLLGDTNADWKYLSHKDPASKGRYFVFQHRSTGIQLGVWENRDILFVSGNASKLKSGNYHNGTIATEADDLLSGIQTMKNVLEPIMEESTFNYEVTSLEIGGVVEKPFSDFWPMLSHLKYKGQHKAPQLYPGESIKWGTSNSSKFSLIIYDKGKQLNGKYKFCIPENTYTRVEIKLRDGKIEKAFGEKMSEFNNQTMHDVFYDYLYRLMPEATNTLSSFPTTVTGLLARNMALDVETNGDSRSTADWWIQDRKNKDHAKKVLKEATAMLNSIKSWSLKDLVPVDAPVIHLPTRHHQSQVLKAG